MWQLLIRRCFEGKSGAGLTLTLTQSPTYRGFGGCDLFLSARIMTTLPS